MVGKGHYKQDYKFEDPEEEFLRDYKIHKEIETFL